MKKILFLLIFSLNPITGKTQLNALVGSDEFCQFQSIKEAYLTGAKEIRVTNQNILRDDFLITSSVIIKGGYGNCASAAYDILDKDENGQVRRTIWSGENSKTVIKVSGVENRPTSLILNNFSIVEGQFEQSTFAGGVNIQNHSLVSLDNVDVINNVGLYGGGIYIEGENSNLSLFNSRVLSNSAQIGGGIFCKGGEANHNQFKHLIVDSLIAENNAVENGGGLAMTSHCRITTTSGYDQNDFSEFLKKGINRNHSGIHGGGVSLSGYSTLTLNAIDLKLPSISGNSSDMMGGAVFLTNSQLNVINGRIDHNTAYSKGGAIYADGESFINLKKGHIANNRVYADLEGKAAGGAIFLYNSAGYVTGVDFINNAANTGLLAMIDSSESVKFESNLITYHSGSPGAALIGLYNTTPFHFIHNTVTKNPVGSVIGFTGNSNMEAIIENNIINNGDETIVNVVGAPNLQIQALFNAISNDDLLNSDQIISIGNMQTIEFHFHDEENNDYSLSPFSDFIDYAPRPISYQETDDDLYDFNGYVRGNNAENIDIFGVYDLGAYEFQGPGHNNDTIFSNSFD